MEDELAIVFDEFCSFGAGHRRTGPPTMDSRTCQKVAKDCGLIDKCLNRTDVDLIFARVKPKGEGKISFPHFIEVTRLWAKKKNMSQEQLVAAILHSRGPQFNHATMAQYNRFHDDKEHYTGVHQHGGPTTHDKKITLANLADRSPSDIRGRKFSDLHFEATKEQLEIDALSHAAAMTSLHGDQRDEISMQSAQRRSSVPLAGSSGGVSRKEEHTMSKPGELHPDYYQVVNPNSSSAGDQFYYVNRMTNEPTWERVLVPGPPPPGSPAKQSATPPNMPNNGGLVSM